MERNASPVTFEQYMGMVDRLMVRHFRLDSGSLEDWNWFDAFTDGLAPKEAVNAWADDNGLQGPFTF